MDFTSKDGIRSAVRNNYRKYAVQEDSGCGCSATCCSGDKNVDNDMISAVLGYSADELASLPAGSNLGLGCGNPIREAQIKAGETVVDLGSGGGIDCFLASKAAGDSGKVIGVDMTPEMISKARKSAEENSVGNVEFRLGEIENLPVGDSLVDVIISNCVINLSPEKDRVFSECYRVLKKGGRIAVSDIVATADLPAHVRQDLALISGCMGGASSVEEIKMMLAGSGFGDISITPKDESRNFISEWAPGSRMEDYVVSAVIKAVKH